jgi:branched-chain amino acid transport system substrate-binding protein
VVLEKVIPVALKAGRPGTPEFRAAIRSATESMGRTVVAHGVLNYTKTNHWGFTTETGLVLKVVNGDWKIEQ